MKKGSSEFVGHILFEDKPETNDIFFKGNVRKPVYNVIRDDTLIYRGYLKAKEYACLKKLYTIKKEFVVFPDCHQSRNKIYVKCNKDCVFTKFRKDGECRISLHATRDKYMRGKKTNKVIDSKILVMFDAESPKELSVKSDCIRKLVYSVSGDIGETQHYNKLHTC